MLSDRELFISAITSSLVSPIATEISDQSRLIILKHIRDTICQTVTDDEWLTMMMDVKENLNIFEKSAFHGIVAHVSGIKFALPKKVKHIPSPDFKRPSDEMQKITQNITQQATPIPINDIIKFETSPERTVMTRIGSMLSRKKSMVVEQVEDKIEE